MTSKSVRTRYSDSNSITQYNGITITGVNVTDASYNWIDDTAVNTAGGYIQIKGYGFVPGSKVYFNNALIANTYISASEYRAVIPATSAGTYPLMIFNSLLNSGSIYANLTTSGFPSFTTTSYTIGSLVVSVQLVASGDAPLTYTLYSGSLPSGLSLSSSGLISGTATSATTSSFDVLVTDGQNQSFQQTITLIILSGEAYWKNTTLLINGEPGSIVWEDVSSTNSVATIVNPTTPILSASSRSPFPSPTATDGSLTGFGGNYFTLPDIAAFDLTADFTLEFWAITTSYAGSGGSGMTWIGGGNDNGSWFFIADSATVVSWYFGGSTIATATGLTNSTTDWIHWAVCRSGSSLRIFKNGTQVGSTATSSTNFTLNGVLYVGAQVAGKGYFNGYLSNLRITKQALYTTTFTPSTVALTTTSQGANSANVILLTCQTSRSNNNNIIRDSSNNDIAVVRNSTVSQGTFTPTGNTWSAFFDGTSDYISKSALTATTLNMSSHTTWCIECFVYFNVARVSDMCFLSLSRPSGFTGAAPYLQLLWGARGWVADASTSTTNLWTGGRIFSDVTPVIGKWYHVALCKFAATGSSGNNGNIGLFVDGAFLGYSYYNSVEQAYAELTIGGLYFTSAYQSFHFGYVSNVRITGNNAVYGATSAPYAGVTSGATIFTPPTQNLTVTQSASSNIAAITAGQVKLLTLQNNSIVDNSTSAHTLTRNGDAAITKFSPFNPSYAYDQTVDGVSYIFNGTSDYLSIASNSLLNWGAGDFTFEFWAYLNASSIPANASIWDHRNGTNGAAVAQPDVELASAIGYSFYTRATTRFSSGTAAVKLRQWQHIAIVRSSGTTRMYVDGIQTGGTYADAVNYPGGSVNIGRANDGVSTRYFPGYFYNMRLTIGTALYTANTTISTAPYIQRSNVNTSFLLAGSSTAVIDNAMMNNFVTNGDVILSPVQKKFGTKSYFFDGTGDYITAGNNAQQFYFNTGDFTIEGWLYTTTVAAGSRTICATRTSASDTTAGRFTFGVSTAALYFYSASATVVSGGTVVANTWTHFAVTRSSGSMRLFLNGTQVGSTTSYTSTMPASLALTIGATAAGTESWSGYIDELRITKGYARYVANFTAPTTALPLQ